MNDLSIVTALLPDGTADPANDPGLSDGQLLDVYGKMTLLRALDEKGIALQRSGRIGFYVPSAGQEACSVGAGFCIREGDWFFPSYRDHGMALMRGCSLATLVAQLFGNSSDATRGRQMPNHWCDGNLRLVSVSSPVATQLPHAVGAAYASKLRGEPVATIASFGDGGTSTGEFHAAMNFAGVFRTPTVFLCENNQYAISVHVTRQTASASLAAKAVAYGIPGIRVDGNDVLAVCKATRDALDRARSGGGPTLIEAVTYRLGPHSTSDDPTAYRAEEEVAQWRKKDPIRRFAAFLRKRGLLDDAAEEAARSRAKEAVRRAVEEVESAPPVPVESLFDDVYEKMPWHLAEQRDALLAGKG
ncbi:MAG: pyruvate dehydrogenase (acetyl-transferring) E1 component subunit alpha [Deltaproteobacteria bacterium]|nr:pyruvate dehydrogenase (acetyl-transferring) E1 component subunit alpha [Deltaproteobacteria bacterium]